MIEIYAPSDFRYNSSFKIILVLLLFRKLCKKYGETLSFPSKICRHTNVLHVGENFKVHQDVHRRQQLLMNAGYIITPWGRPLRPL